MIILDSDIFTLYTYSHANVTKHYNAVPVEEDLAVTIITRMEILRGRTDSVLKAADERELRIATERLQQTEAILNALLLLPIDDAAIQQFGVLRKQKKVNKMKRADMLIACIALAQNALLVTRNTRDFEKVTGLQLANWADA
jgi:predicted nucleic acid-binding protein